MAKGSAHYDPGEGFPAKFKQITAAGILIAAFLVAASIFLSWKLTGKFAELEKRALWSQTDNAHRHLRASLTEFIYQLQFVTFEDIPQYLATPEYHTHLATPFSKLNANMLDVDAALLFDSNTKIVAAHQFTGSKKADRQPAPAGFVDAVSKALRNRTAAPTAFFLPVGDSIYFVAANPVVDLRQVEPDRTVGTLVFCRDLTFGYMPDPENPDVTLVFKAGAPAGLTPESGTPLPELTETSVSWDPSGNVTVAFYPETYSRSNSMSPYTRLQEIREFKKASWPVNLILSNPSPVALHRDLTAAKLTLTPPQSRPGKTTRLSRVVAVANQPAGLPAVRIEALLPSDFSLATAASRRLVQSVFATAAILICLFTAYVLREILRRQRIERDFAFTSHQKDQLLSVIAHDLRAPLTGVGNLACLMANTDASFTREELETYAQEIHLTSKRLTELLENLLSWAHLKSGRLPINPADIHFPRLTGQVARLFQPAASAKAIHIEVSTGSVTTVHSDPEIIRTVFRNLLSNAIHHTPEGGAIEITAERTNNDLHFAVTDTGVGTPADKIAAILSDPRGSAPKGKGFGLVLCREMVEMLGGAIRAENRPGGGCRISVVIPGATNAPPPQPDATTNPSSHPSRNPDHSHK